MTNISLDGPNRAGLEFAAPLDVLRRPALAPPMSNSLSIRSYEKFRVQKSKIDLAFELFIAGESIRRTARQVRVAPSTIQRWNEYFYQLA